MRRVHTIAAWAIIALAAIHLSLTWQYSGGQLRSMRALNFAGSGVAILVAGLMNVMAGRVRHDRLTRGFCVATNVTMAVLFTWGFAVLPQPQVVLLWVLFAVAAVTSVFVTRRPRA
jgi:hypothetical protein